MKHLGMSVVVLIGVCALIEVSTQERHYPLQGNSFTNLDLTRSRSPSDISTPAQLEAERRAVEEAQIAEGRQKYQLRKALCGTGYFCTNLPLVAQLSALVTQP